MRQKDEAKAQEILRATLEEVQASGLAGLAIEAVARNAGVATGTVYTYFKSKEDLLDSLFRHTKLAIADVVVPHEGLAFRPAFVATVAASLDYVIEHQSEIVFMVQMANSPYLTAETKVSATESSVRPIMALLERGKAEQLLKALEPAWMATFFIETIRAMAPLGAGLPPARYREFQDAVASMCWDALRA